MVYSPVGTLQVVERTCGKLRAKIDLPLSGLHTIVEWDRDQTQVVK